MLPSNLNSHKADFFIVLFLVLLFCQTKEIKKDYRVKVCSLFSGICDFELGIFNSIPDEEFIFVSEIDMHAGLKYSSCSTIPLQYQEKHQSHAMLLFLA